MCVCVCVCVCPSVRPSVRLSVRARVSVRGGPRLPIPPTHITSPTHSPRRQAVRLSLDLILVLCCFICIILTFFNCFYPRITAILIFVSFCSNIPIISDLGDTLSERQDCNIDVARIQDFLSLSLLQCFHIRTQSH